MAADGFKQTPHSPKCYLASQGREEYIVPGGLRTADKLGRTYSDRRGTTWQAFRCNCIACDSEVWVRWDVLMHWLADGLRNQSAPTVGGKP